MRQLKIMEHISLDGVIQHSADGDDFPYSGAFAASSHRTVRTLCSRASPR